MLQRRLYEFFPVIDIKQRLAKARFEGGEHCQGRLPVTDLETVYALAVRGS